MKLAKGKFSEKISVLGYLVKPLRRTSRISPNVKQHPNERDYSSHADPHISPYFQKGSQDIVNSNVRRMVITGMWQRYILDANILNLRQAT